MKNKKQILLHEYDEQTPIGETISAIGNAIQNGKGKTNHLLAQTRLKKQQQHCIGERSIGLHLN